VIVPTTLGTLGDLAVCVAAALVGQRTQQRLLGRRPGDLSEVRHAGATTARRGGLVLTNRHLVQPPQLTGPPKASIRSPSASLTIARFVSLRLPQPVRVRLRLPSRLSVFTVVKRTVKIF